MSVFSTPETAPQRLIIGITGASGVIYGVKLLQLLQSLPIESHLVVTKAAEMTLAYETDYNLKDLRELADVTYPVQDVGAAISSGSFKTLGMIVAPCSMRSLGEIANALSSNLLTRAADVVLKERRKLVLMLRETPLHSAHIRNMLQASELGAIIAPPVPAFYTRPDNLDDIITHAAARCLDLFGIETNTIKRWGEGSAQQRRPKP